MGHLAVWWFLFCGMCDDNGMGIFWELWPIVKQEFGVVVKYVTKYVTKYYGYVTCTGLQLCCSC